MSDELDEMLKKESDRLGEHIIRHLLKWPLPPDTRTPFQKWKGRLRNRWTGFRVWLSRKIYYWEYE